MHPSQDDLREEVMIEADEDAEAAINDSNLILDGFATQGTLEDMDAQDRLKGAIERKKKPGKLQKIGLGADIDEVDDADPSKLDKRELPLPTREDVRLVQKHLGHLIMGTNVSATISGSNLIMVGKESRLDRAQALVITLMETGAWVALADTFVVSEEAKAKKKAEDDGPIEQILIKVPEGRATQMIGQYLKSIKGAAEAQNLKLSSKPIGGKRTLMVEGTRKTHERVKLMAKELAEKGESPMLTKFLNRASSEPAQTNASRTEKNGVISAAPILVTEVKKEEDAVTGEDGATIVKCEVKTEVKWEVKEELEEKPEIDLSKPEVDDPDLKFVSATKGTGPAPAAPAMRRLPAPRLAADCATGTALFSNLPAAAKASGGSGSGAAPLMDLFAGLPSEVSVSAGEPTAAPDAAVSLPLPIHCQAVLHHKAPEMHLQPLSAQHSHQCLQ